MVNIIVPLIVLFVVIYGMYKGIDIFDTFILGIKEGLRISLNIFPTIFAMMVSVNVFIGSNIINDISLILNSRVFPIEVLPLALSKPISGSTSLVLLNDILSKYGPDSFIGRVSSVMQGSTDTTIYIIGLYYSSIGIKNIRYSLVIGLLADFISILLSILIVNMYF